MLHEPADGGVGIGGGGPSTASLAPLDSSTVAQEYHAAAERTERSVAAMLVDGDAAVRMRAVLALGKLPPQLVESQLHALLRCV
jgi:hypothetical protein